jgi:hypothetical protein
VLQSQAASRSNLRFEAASLRVPADCQVPSTSTVGCSLVPFLAQQYLSVGGRYTYDTAV